MTAEESPNTERAAKPSATRTKETAVKNPYTWGTGRRHRFAALAEKPLKQELEPVAFLDVPLKIDVPAKDTDGVHHDLHRHAGAARGQEQGVADFTLCADDLAVQGARRRSSRWRSFRFYGSGRDGAAEPWP